MKNISLILITLIVFAVFAGCNAYESGDSEATESSAASDSTQDSKEEPTEVVIVKDPTKKLETTKESKKDIRDMMLMMATEGFISAEGHDFTLKHVQDYISVTQIREIPPEYGLRDHTFFYSAHDCTEGGRLFVFYLPQWIYESKGYRSGNEGEREWEDSLYDYHARITIFTEKDLSDQDFSVLNVGVSTIEDVERIDPATRFNLFTRGNEENINWYIYDFRGSDSSDYSVHFTQDGYVCIGYEKVGEDFIVSDVSNIEDSIIAAIEKIDWLY